MSTPPSTCGQERVATHSLSIQVQAAGLEQFEPASTECRALREAAHAGAGASIATSLAAAVAMHLAASLGVISTACDAV